MSKLKEFVFNKVMSIFIFNISKKKKEKRKEKNIQSTICTSSDSV